MLSNFFKNMKIDKKILSVILGLSIVVQIFMLIMSYMSMSGINGYSVREISDLSSQSSKIGRESLKSQSENYLSNISDSLSKNVDSSFDSMSAQVTANCKGIEKIISSKNNFKGFIPLLPEFSETSNPSSKGYVIDSSGGESSPLVYDMPDYSSDSVHRLNSDFWKNLSDSEKKEIVKNSAVVSENKIPENLYSELITFSNCEYFFEPIFKSDPCVSSIYLGTEDGIFYKYSNDNSSERYDPRTRPWYKSAVLEAKNSDSPVWQNAYVSKTTGKFCITCSKAFKSSNGNILGVCAMDMYIDDISNLVTRLKIGDSGYNFIVDSSGNIVMHPEYALIFENESSFENYNLSNSDLIKKVLEEKSGILNEEIGGERYYVSHIPMATNNWTWVSVVKESEIMEPISKIENLLNNSLQNSKEALKKDFLIVIVRFIVVFLLNFVVVYFISKKLSRSLSRPIVNLSEATKDIGKGDFDLNLTPESTDEIGQLANSFNLMAENLKKYMEDLKKTTAEKERIHSELMIAKKIQRSMLPCIFPAFPERKDLDIYAVMDPAREVGGDFYDFFFIDEDHLALVIADVSGKGISAALFMVIAKILIKNQLQSGDSPAVALKTVNNRLCENNEADMFVTCFLGVLNIKTGKFVYSNAGHNPPYLYRRAENTCTSITDPHDFVLGGVANLEYKENETYLYPEDFLLLYTDGVTEASNIKGKLFSDNKLEEIIVSCANKNLTIQNLIATIKEEIDKFVGKAEVSDDITMLAFKNFTIVPFKDPKDLDSKNR